MARPKIEIDKKFFEKLCGLQCTLEEIAGVFDCSPDTIERWCKRQYKMGFAETYKKHSASGKISLRRAQFKLAEKSAAMAIFLGKNYLGQTDCERGIESENVPNDGFIKALTETASADWSEADEESDNVSV